MPNSVGIGFGPAMKTGSSRQFKQYPTTYMWVSNRLPFTHTVKPTHLFQNTTHRLPKFPRTHRGDILPLVVVAKKHFAQILATVRALLYAFTVDYGLSWFILIHIKGSRLETHISVTKRQNPSKLQMKNLGHFGGIFLHFLQQEPVWSDHFFSFCFIWKMSNQVPIEKS